MADKTKAEIQADLDAALTTIEAQAAQIEQLEQRVGPLDADFGPVFGPDAVPLEAR